MAKHKPPQGRPGHPKKPVRYGSPLRVWIPPQLRKSLDRLTEKTRRSLTTEVVMALEAHLQAAGLWPPPAED